MPVKLISELFFLKADLLIHRNVHIREKDGRYADEGQA
jgi:hypothetical protein